MFDGPNWLGVAGLQGFEIECGEQVAFSKSIQMFHVVRSIKAKLDGIDHLSGQPAPETCRP